jgi:glycosyltransferase involved in cell wall biosynthesis
MVPRVESAVREMASANSTRGPESNFPRVGIAHDWLTVPGGSEKVVLALLELFPQAELFTTIYDPSPWPEAITSRPVHTSFLNRVPRARSIYPKLLPLMNAAFESFDLSKFDLVISSNHACAKNVITGPQTPHICYCHTPMRYAWEPEFLREEDIGPVGRVTARLLLGRLRRLDAIAASRPDAYVANSTHVAARIEKYYRRSARVIPPPVEVDHLIATPRHPEDYYLAFGRVVPYKRVDLAVAACARLGRPLKVVGEGRALDDARAAAAGNPDIEFLGYVPDPEVPRILGGARALLFPGEEDFGVVPVEAQAAGVPVVAYGVGGITDSVQDGETGVLYKEPTTDGLCEAIRRFERLGFDEHALRDNARLYAPERFRTAFMEFLAEVTDPAKSEAVERR